MSLFTRPCYSACNAIDCVATNFKACSKRFCAYATSVFSAYDFNVAPRQFSFAVTLAPLLASTAFLRAVAVVIHRCAFKQMAWVYTSRMIACMTNKFVGPTTCHKVVYPSVHKNLSLAATGRTRVRFGVTGFVPPARFGKTHAVPNFHSGFWCKLWDVHSTWSAHVEAIYQIPVLAAIGGLK